MASAGFRKASDQSMFVDFGDSITTGAHRHVLQLLRWFETHPVAGVRNLHPAYNSVLVVFDPLVTGHEAIEHELSSAHIEEIDLRPPRLIEIPVRYDGPDLPDVAEFHGIPARRVVELHCSPVYTVYFLGFVPGFAYLGGLPPAIATPRLPSPRTHVPAGSVGIAGEQTGIYPFITPGGWRLIGRTDVKMFDPEREEMSLLTAGDHVRFIAA